MSLRTHKYLFQASVYRWLLLFTPVLSPAGVSGQDFKIPRQSIPVYHEGFRTLVQVYDGNKSVKKPDNARFYYWLKAKEIHASKGGYEGDLLHGEYTVFYDNENLREKGKFSMGLKQGTWKSWHRNGELMEISRWKDGRLQGEMTRYDEEGKLLTKSKYRLGKLDGKQYTYSDSLTRIVKFRDGVEVKPRAKKSRIHLKKNARKEIEKSKEETMPDEKTAPDEQKKTRKKWFGRKRKPNVVIQEKEEKKKPGDNPKKKEKTTKK